MSDKEINVKVSASTSGIESAMQQATNSVRDGLGHVRESFAGLGESIESAHREIIGFLAAFEGLKKLKEMVDSTNKMNVESIKMARQLGITAGEARKLQIALDDSYVSSETYVSAALKMTRQLKQNEGALQALGLVTRDSNGELRDTNDLVLEGIQVLNSYKEGTDRNLAAQVMFGRGAGELGEMLTFTKEKLEEGSHTLDKFNLGLSKEGVEATQHYRAAMNELHDGFEGLEKTVGEALMPVMTDLASQFADNIPMAIEELRVALNVLVSAFRVVYLGVEMLWDLIKLFVRDATVLFTGLSNAMGKLFSGDFAGAKASFAATWDSLKAETRRSFDEMLQDAEKSHNAIEAVWSGKHATTKSDTSTSNGKDKSYEAFDKGAADEAAKAAAAAAKKAKEEQMRLAEETAKGIENLELTEVDRHKQHLDQMLKDGEISNAQWATSMQEEIDREFAAQEDFERKKVKIYADDVVEKRKSLDMIALLEKKHLLETEKLQNKARDDQKKRFESMMAPITNAIEKSITGIIMGTTTLKKAMQNIFQSILGEAFSMISKIVVKWIAGELLKTQATETGAAVRTATETGAATAGMAASGGAAMVSIMNNAWAAMAGAFQAMCAIPIIGPALGVAAGAAAFAAVAGIAGSVKSAAGGYDIPAGLNPMVQAHAEEMILPAKYANLIRGMAEGGGGQGGGGGSGDTHHYTINAVDSKSFEGYLKKNAHVLGPALGQLRRNGGMASKKK